jgi:DNA-binding MarR family transcriptional regulator
VRDWEKDMPIPIRRIIAAATDTTLNGSDINLFALIALRASKESDGCTEVVITLREMGEALGAGISTVSRSISKLEDRGYIQRKARTRISEPTTINILPPSSHAAA